MRRPFACVLSWLGACAAQAPAQRIDAEDAVDRILAPFARADGPGCAVALSDRGRTGLERAFGLADLEHRVPNMTTTVFEAGSVSKQFTAAAILILAAEGRLRLDDDVRTYLPELPDYGAVITIDHLLNHTSGLRDWQVLDVMAGWPLHSRVHTNAEVLAIAARQRALNHPPGSEFLYNSTGYNLAAIVVERVSGQSLATFSQHRLFTPLGMTATQWRDDFQRLVPNRASGHRRVGGHWAISMPFDNSYGSAGLLTTIGDLMIWNRALAEGRLGGTIAARMAEMTVLPGGPAHYGRGVFLRRYRGQAEIGHDGAIAGYRAFTARYPGSGVAVAVLCNGSIDAAQIGRSLVDPALPASPEDGQEEPAGIAMPGQGTQPERWQPTQEALEEFVGRYFSEDIGATYAAAIETGKLVLRVESRFAPGWSLDPTREDRFVFEMGSVQFVRGEDGRVREMRLSSERVRSLGFRKL
jgi:CubicO group peptidase (beta-lactamase class C family)